MTETPANNSHWTHRVSEKKNLSFLFSLNFVKPGRFGSSLLLQQNFTHPNYYSPHHPARHPRDRHTKDHGVLESHTPKLIAFLQVKSSRLSRRW
jgi:hypothetical protein